MDGSDERRYGYSFEWLQTAICAIRCVKAMIFNYFQNNSLQPSGREFVRQPNCQIDSLEMCNLMSFWTCADFRITESKLISARLVYNRCWRSIACVIRDGLSLGNETNDRN